MTSESILLSPPTENRLRFGRIAAHCDRVRPGYPDELIDAVFHYGRPDPLLPALDVGAGTGQATLQFAARGQRVIALEPSPEMVEIANSKFALSGVDARPWWANSRPRRWARTATADLPATAWHWLNPETCFQVAARAIAPGGTLAVLSTWPLWRRTALRPALDEIYAASGAPLAEMGPMCPVEPDPGALAREWVRETDRSGAFGDQQGKLAAWSGTYSAAGYVDLLGSYGDHIGLEPDVRERLFAGIRRVVESAGGAIEVSYSTLLLLARAR